MALLPGMPLLPFLLLAGGAGAGAWFKREADRQRAEAPPPDAAAAAPAAEPPVAETLRMDLLRLELGYGLLSLAAGEAPR